MNRYDSYKPTGIAGIGEIPEHWKVKKLNNAVPAKANHFNDGDYIESISIIFKKF